MTRALIAVALLIAAPAWAGEVYSDDVATVAVGGDVKTFFLASFPYEHAIMPEDPFAQGILDFRLKFEVELLDRVKFVAHHTMTAFAPGQSGFGLGIGGGNSGVAIQVPEAVKLSWIATDTEDFTLRGRMDRLFVRVDLPSTAITLGRQPMSFGNGMFFAPMDLVAPFSPSTIDTEYKPGVDALRVDIYPSMSSSITAAAAYAGDWRYDGMIFALYGQHTFGTWDVGLFTAMTYGDVVVGLTSVGSAGPVGLHAEATVTVPDPFTSGAAAPTEDVFVRGLVGADYRPTTTTTLMVELYAQSIGTSDSDAYLDVYSSDRFLRGELWTAGHYYAGLSVAQEVTPIIYANLALILNLGDPSMLIVPGVVWTVSDNVELVGGAYFSVGKRPGDLDPTAPNPLPTGSEFGLTPATGYVQLKAYF